MKTNYILDIKNNTLEVCSEVIAVHKISSYNCKVLQVLINNEWNQLFEIYRFTHYRSKSALFIALAILGDLGLEIEISSCSCKMFTQIWIK